MTINTITTPDGYLIVLPDLEELREQAAPVYHQYPRQTKPQDAYLELDGSGELRVSWDAEIGNAMPMSVWHKRDLRWGIPNTLRGNAIAEFLERDDIQALLARVYDGHHVEWNGSNDVGILTPDAEYASEELALFIEANLHDENKNVALITAMDWLQDAIAYVREDGTETRLSHEAESFSIAFGDDSATIDRNTPREDLYRIALRIELSAMNFDSTQAHYITDSTADYLHDLQQELVRKGL